ncbi:uncharacterized protein [Pocillopora verrucosa]|uniref:uncharacterized protein n=1 Tax=Pocillopora verrucosa TaxID=203993 RepID=UPI00333E460D
MSRRGAEFGDEYAISESEYHGDDEASSSDSSDDGNQVLMVPDKTSITGISGDAAKFILISPQDLPPDLTHASAHFVKDGDFGEVQVELVKINPRNLIGFFPSSLTPGEFRVRVTSSDGSFLGIAFFSCWDNTSETLERLRHEAPLQSVLHEICVQNVESLRVLYDDATPALCRVNEQEPGDTCDGPEIGPDDPQQDAPSVGESLNVDQHPSTDKTGRS